MVKKAQENYTYILQCADGSFYTGWTNNLQRRLKAHNEGKASKYTRSRRPVKILYYESFETKQEAMRREFAIKQLSRREKERLIDCFTEAEQIEKIEIGKAKKKGQIKAEETKQKEQIKGRRDKVKLSRKNK